MSPSLSDGHRRLKKIRGRGEVVQHNLAVVRYLRSLEAELEAVQAEIFKAWSELDKPRDYRKFMKHADHAQQRLHRSIKKLKRAA